MVALRMESVDRNVHTSGSDPDTEVALRMESVDRNAGEPTQNVGKSLSLSTWRARVEDMSRYQRCFVLITQKRPASSL